MSRQSREQRRKGVRVQLTERDELLLEALVRFRLARTSDLARTAFPGVRPTTCSLRLRRLFDAGYVDVRLGDRSEENVYSLGPLGKRWAEAEGLVVGRVPRGGVEHHLGIVRAWSTLAAELERFPGVELELARADWDLREEFGVQGLALVPDLLLVVRAGGGSMAVGVEVDLGTESLAVFRAKVETYAELADRRTGLFGHRDFGMAVGVGAAGRMAGVRHVLASAWPGRSAVWLLRESPAVVLSDLLGTATHPDYGNGGAAVVSASESCDELVDEEGL